MDCRIYKLPYSEIEDDTPIWLAFGNRLPKKPKTISGIKDGSMFIARLITKKRRWYQKPVIIPSTSRDREWDIRQRSKAMRILKGKW